MTAQNSNIGALQFEAGGGWTGLYFTETARDQIVANPGGGQANATMLPCMFNRVVTVANFGDSVRLPPALPGADLMVLNAGVNAMAVFGTANDQVDGAGVGVSVSQMPNSVVLYSSYSLATGWQSEGLATGFAASGLQTLSNQSLTASTTHTQGGATPITAMLVAATVANAADAILLPPAVPGLQISIANLSATLAGQLYASGTDTINGVAGATGIALTAAVVTIVFCVQAGKWLTK
jgi:hypothetical protein